MTLLTPNAGAPAWTWLGFVPSDVATIVAAALGALIAAIVIVGGYRAQKDQARREHRVQVYAEALRAVEDYLEAPYLVRRRDGSHQRRQDLVGHVSEVQSRIELHRGWLRLHATPETCDAYEEFVRAARAEAGSHMTTAWKSRPVRRDRDVPLTAPLPRPRSDAARRRLLEAMSVELR